MRFSVIVCAVLSVLAALPVNAQVAAAGADSLKTGPAVLSLDQALQIALNENVSVKVADMEIERTGYAKKGTYASLFPQVNASAVYQRTIKKQVMYMDMDEDGGGMSGMFTDIMSPIYNALGLLAQGTGIDISQALAPSVAPVVDNSSDGGIAVGRWNTYMAGLTANMPLVNFQLWEGLKLSGQDVELAVEKARSSRLDMVTQVKQAYYSVLLAKEVLNVYNEVYENALRNFEQTQKRYNVQKASEFEYVRAKSTVENAIPNVYNAESSVILALWQLKAVMGVDLDMEIDVAGGLGDYGQEMFYDIHRHDDATLDYNTTMRQLAIQADELAANVRMQKAAYIPTLSATFSYSLNAMTNDFKFSNYKWTPYSYVGLSLNIPIFSGGKRLSDVRQSQIRANELALQTQDAERQLKIGIRQALNTMETKMKSYVAAQDAVNTAAKAYAIAEKSYDVGRSTITELNDAQLALTQAQLGVSQAIFEFMVAKAGLEQILGYDFVSGNGSLESYE